MLTLHTSNQLEQLTAQFANTISKPLEGVFTPELVVVQNAGMARYLSLHVADKNNISANTDYLFPAEFMWQMLKSVLPNLSDQDPSSPHVLRWRLLSLLFDEMNSENPDFPELSHYLTSQESAWDLSLQFSDILDKILFYRDDWVQDWENPEKAHQAAKDNWQARLWQKLVTEKQLDHWLALQNQFIKAIHLSSNHQLLPERVSFFSLSALSPGYIRLLGELGKVIDIHLYIINPCQAYWGDIEPEKSIIRKPTEEQPYFDSGNALLSSMGRQGRDFIDQLIALPDVIEQESFIETNVELETTLLSQIQNDILNLVPSQSLTEESSVLTKNDNSIQFHACHTALREVEVLHDQLLALLQHNDQLAPADIIVMMPDIEKYASYIEAIFSSDSDSYPKLPFSIADQNPDNAQASIEAFLKVLSLNDKRFDVESVFELLDYDFIREKFNLKPDDLLFCREIARATNIRWGISASSRKKANLPNTDEHTWRYALKRVLLGYTLSGDESFYPNGDQAPDDLALLPFKDIEGSQAIIVSHLIQFTDALFKLEKLQHQQLSIDAWMQAIRKLITSLFADESQNNILFKALDKLNQQASLAGLSDTNETQKALNLPFSVVRKMITQALQEISGSDKYLGYGITFCALVPMRSVPFKVIALLGLNDGEYPRQDRPASFDDVAKAPRKGDRSRRNEDRYLFLESLMAAREKLIISYIGQSVKDNTALPPSVLVSELLDELCIYTESTHDDWICKHPLQAFSPRYFNNTDERLFSYQAEYTKLGLNQKETSPHFISKPLEPLPEDNKQVHIDELIQFFKSPARAFLKRRFSINHFNKDLVLPIREPFELESFKDREIRQTLLDAKDQSSVPHQVDSLDRVRDIVRAKGLLPYGEIGDKLFENEAQTIDLFVAQLPSFEPQENLNFLLELTDGFTLYGELNKLTGTGRVIQQVGSAYAGDYIELWLKHLVLNALNSNKQKSYSYFYSPELSFQLEPCDDATKNLAALLNTYWKGLHFPLHFFPKSAFKQYKKNQSKGNLKVAIDAWNTSFIGSPEKDKFENWLLYRGLDNNALFDAEYEAITELIFGNLYTHLFPLSDPTQTEQLPNHG